MAEKAVFQEWTGRKDLQAVVAGINGQLPADRGWTLVDTHPFGPTRGVEKYRLTNGLVLLLLVDDAAPLFAYQTWFRVGSAYETPGKTGLAHLFEHLMFKATRTLGDGQFDRILEAEGASTNAATWVDWTYYKESLPAGQLDLVARLEADRMVNLLLTESQVRNELEVVKNERRLRVDDDPDGLMFETLYAAAYTAHPYRWPTIGWMEDLERLTLDDCLDFYKRHYAPNHATVVLVGDVARDEALTVLAHRYGALERQPALQATPAAEPVQREARSQTLRLPVAAPKLLLGYHAPTMTDPLYAALEVLNEILFDGESSRVYRRLVQDEELAVGISGWMADTRHAGLYEVFVAGKPDSDPDLLMRSLDAEVERLCRQGPTAREVEKGQNRLEADWVRGLESAGARARVLGSYETLVDDYRWLFRVADAYRAVTVASVQAVARQYLQPHNRTWVLALPNGQSPTDADDDEQEPEDEIG